MCGYDTGSQRLELSVLTAQTCKCNETAGPIDYRRQQLTRYITILWGHDPDPSGSRDVISHVTVGFTRQQLTYRVG